MVRRILSRRLVIPVFTLIVVGPSLHAQDLPPVQIAAVQWQASEFSGYVYNADIRIGLAQSSINRLRNSRFRVRIVTGDRAALLRLRPDWDGCVTIPAASYSARLYGAGILLADVSEDWLAKLPDGRATGRVYMVFIELDAPAGQALRIRYTDLQQYLNAGLPIVIEPPADLTRAELIALGRQISPGRPFVGVTTCRRLQTRLVGILEFVADGCGAGDENSEGVSSDAAPSEHISGAKADHATPHSLQELNRAFE